MQSLRSLYPIRRIEEIYVIYFRHKTFLEDLFEFITKLKPLFPDFNTNPVFSRLKEVPKNDP